MVSLAPLFRSSKICENDRTGDLMSIAVHSAAVEIEKARTTANHPLVNGRTVFPDPRQRETSNSIREIGGAATRKMTKKERDDLRMRGVESVKTVFEWFANTAKTYIEHAKFGWAEIVNGKTHWHGGDRNHGVTAVPRKKKTRESKQPTENASSQPDRFTRHNRHITEADAGVYREATGCQCEDGILYEVSTRPWRIDLDSSVKFDRAKEFPDSHQVVGHDRFVRVWNWLDILMGVEQGILKPGGELDIEGWLECNFTDAKDRQVLAMRAEGHSVEKIAKETGLTPSKVKTRLTHAEKLCFSKLGVQQERTTNRLNFGVAPLTTIQDVATQIECRRAIELRAA